MSEEELFEDYQRYFNSDDVVSYWQESRFELNVQVEDGTIYRYNGIEHWIRKVLPGAAVRMAQDEDYFRLIFGLNLERMMQERGVTRYALADMADVSYPSLTQYINHNMTPTIHTVFKIANALECDISEFVKP